jgi:hypothetical protein
MKKPILITFCCAGLMLVTPLVGVAQENTVSNNLSELPNDVEGLVAQIRTVVDEILQRYGHIPIIAKQCGIILNLLELVGYMIICIFLIMLFIPVFILHTVFLLLRLEYLRQYMAMFTVGIGLLTYVFCPPYNEFISKLPFQSIYTMLETKDNINTFDGCPCLQD